VTTVVKLYREQPTVFFKTPTANLGSNGAAQHPDRRKAGGHGPTLADEVCFLLDVKPEDQEATGPHSPAQWWGKFAPTVRRWEVLTGKAAPIPVMRGARGGIRLSPRFCEWLMGLPEGWVTGVPGVSVNEQIARIGNGVVPAQAYHAFKVLIEAEQQWNRTHEPGTVKPTRVENVQPVAAQLGYELPRDPDAGERQAPAGPDLVDATRA